MKKEFKRIKNLDIPEMLLGDKLYYPKTGLTYNITDIVYWRKSVIFTLFGIPFELYVGIDIDPGYISGVEVEAL